MVRGVPGVETVVGEGEPGKWIRREARAGREGWVALARTEREERRVVIEEACFGIVVDGFGFG